VSTFVYQALRRDGGKANGELEALDRKEAFKKLETQNLQPIFLDLKGAAPVSTTNSVARKTQAAATAGPILLTKNQIITFTEELSDLLEAGLRLEPALRAMEQRVELSNLQSVIENLRHQVREGVSFSSALRSVSNSFGDLYCNLVAAGELSGALPKILRRQVQYLMVMEDLQSRVLYALIYPAFLTVAGIGVLFIFMTQLLPRLKDLIRNGTMPLPTRILISFSNFMTHYWWAVFVGIALLIFAFWSFIQQPEGRKWWDKTKLQIPLFGPVLEAKFYAQFAQTLGTLVVNGVPLLTGLNLMKNATTNVYLKGILTRLADIVTEGRSMSLGMKHVGQFPPVFIDVVQVGEQTGDLGAALEKISKRYDKDLNKRIQQITAFIQPVIIVVLAVVVGLVIYSIITGILQTMNGLKVHRLAP
jgi:type II secretory pathway component PulF